MMFFKKKKKEFVLHFNYNVPNEIYKVKIFDYDKIEALKIFLINEGISSDDAKKILYDKRSFDRAWGFYNNPKNIMCENELHRQLCLIKLLTIEGKTNGESFDAFVLAWAQYLVFYILLHMDFDFPTLKQSIIINRGAFIEGLNESDVNKVFRMIDYSVFDSMAFCSTSLNMTLLELYDYMIYIMEMNDMLFQRYWDVLNGKNVLFGIIGKLLELAYSNYKPSLKKINVNIKKEEERITNDSNFYDFSTLTSVENQKNRYYLTGKNREIALADINKVLGIFNHFLKEKNISDVKPLSVDNLIEYTSYRNKKFSLFDIRYTPITPTGKIAKKMCSLSFLINTVGSPFLKDGIMYTDEIDSSKYNDNASGIINYCRDGTVLDFSISSSVLRIKGNSLNMDNTLEVEFIRNE